MSETASIFIPALVVATLIDEQTFFVLESASGIDFMSFRSPAVMPFCTRALKPPIKSTPTSSAALSSVLATELKSGVSQPSATTAMGVTEILLFIIGIP